jgi:urease accessory protein
MSDVAATMTVLQFGDSFFPSGSVSFSWGLEALSESGVVTDARGIEAFLIGQLRSRWAKFDRPASLAAHRARGDLRAIAMIDAQVEMQTACAEFRIASRRLGEALLSVFARLGLEAVSAYRERVKQGEARGHVAPMQGFVWGLAGLSEAETVALSAHIFTIGLLGAGIRLGLLTHIEAQSLLMAARREAARLAESKLPATDALSGFGLEAEIAVMRHVDNTMRVFAN